MPTSARIFLTAVVVGVLSTFAPFLPGTSEAAAAPSCAPLFPCASETPTPSPTPTASPTPSPTPSASPSPTRTVSPTPRRTRTPEPRSTYTVSPGSTEDPVTGTVEIGGVQQESASPTPTVRAKESSSSSSGGDPLTRLLTLVLGGAVLLGLSGATGLYLTRHRHEH